MHPTAPPRPRTGLRTIVIVAVTAVVTALVVTAAIIILANRSEGQPAYFGGSVTIIDTDDTVQKFTWNEAPMECAGVKEFADVTQGASVVVMDQHGKTLGVAQLGLGVPGGIKQDIFGRAATTCTFPVGAGRAPGRRFYRVKVGQQPPVTVSDLGHLEIRLGS